MPFHYCTSESYGCCGSASLDVLHLGCTSHVMHVPPARSPNDVLGISMLIRAIVAC